MWTQTLKSATKINNGLMVEYVVVFTDGTTTHEIPYRLSEPSSLARTVQNQLDQYEKIAGAEIPVVNAPIELPVRPTPQPPTQDQLDRAAFDAAREKLYLLDSWVEMGVLRADDGRVTAAEQALAAAFVPILAAFDAPAK